MEAEKLALSVSGILILLLYYIENNHKKAVVPTTYLIIFYTFNDDMNSCAAKLDGS